MLQRLGLLEYEEVFKRQELSLTDIVQLNHESLKSIGIRFSGKNDETKHSTAYGINIVQKIFQLRALHPRDQRLRARKDHHVSQEEPQ